MRQSDDGGHFFQTDSAISESKRRSQKAENEAGKPVRLQSKLLAVIADPFNQEAVYVAEAAGTVKRVALETKQTTQTLRPATAAPSPFTCLTILQTTSGSGTLFAGSWDKNIYAWPINASGPLDNVSKETLTGHMDFVKALIGIPGSELGKTSVALLVSASADKSIIVWNAQTLQRLHTLTSHARGVQALALDPLSVVHPSVAAAYGREQGAVIASGDSNREIRFWRVSAGNAREISSNAAVEEEAGASMSQEQPTGEAIGNEDAESQALLVHETSIFGLCFTADGDLWTASADRTAKQLSRSRSFGVDETLQHADYVKAVIIADNVSPTSGLSGPVAITGCRDENVRVWDIGSGKCIACLQGHYDEVTDLALVRDGQAVVSVSIDGTIRVWVLSQQDLELAKQTYVAVETKKEEMAEVALTEDEERELAELMDDDD